MMSAIRKTICSIFSLDIFPLPVLLQPWLRTILVYFQVTPQTTTEEHVENSGGFWHFCLKPKQQGTFVSILNFTTAISLQSIDILKSPLFLSLQHDWFSFEPMQFTLHVYSFLIMWQPYTEVASQLLASPVSGLSLAPFTGTVCVQLILPHWLG